MCNFLKINLQIRAVTLIISRTLANKIGAGKKADEI